MDFSQLIGTFILGKIFYSVYKKEAERMCQECEPFIKKGAKILDLGCGRGITTETFKNFFQAKIYGADIQDQRIVNFPFKIINGKKLPFPDNSFDVVLINYVLHHTKNPLEIIKEAKRVSKNEIIVHEDLEEEGLSRIVCWFHKVTYKISASFQKNPIKFHNEANWEELFNRVGLKTTFKKRTTVRLGWFYPVQNILFVLEK